MSVAAILDRLYAAPGVARRGQPWDPGALVLEPHFGQIVWTPPASYRAAAASGLLAATRFVPSIDAQVGFTLLDGDTFTDTNAGLVHMPEGVSRDPGRYLSTNHLVGFAEARHEAVWCFDVTESRDGEYPVYYHHQDEPRARYVEGGAWEEPPDGPDFDSFTQWLETMVAALVGPEPPGWFERLGQPGLVFTNKRLVL